MCVTGHTIPVLQLVRKYCFSTKDSEKLDHSKSTPGKQRERAVYKVLKYRFDFWSHSPISDEVMRVRIC